MTHVIDVAGRLAIGQKARQQKTQTLDNSRQAQRALMDLADGLRAWQLWGSLGWQDIRERYTRSAIGPFWLTLSMAVLVLSLGFLMGGLFGMPLSEYLPYLATGFIVWGFISTCINDGCEAFYKARPVIRQVPAPLSVYVYRVVWRTFIVFLHNSVIYVAVALAFGIWAGLTNLLLAALAIAVLCLNGVWVGILFGLASARFRDVPPIVASFVQLAFFVTPIFWHVDNLPGRASFVAYNPFLYYLEIVRQPLLGQTPQLGSWLIVLGLTLAGSTLALVAFIRYRRRLSYWV